MVTKFLHFSDLESMSLNAAQAMVLHIKQRLKTQNIFSLVLAGGRTPQTLYTVLNKKFHDKLPWQKIHFFWGDERFVEQNHKYSNYRMVKSSLLNSLNIPNSNIHQIKIDIESGKNTACDYEKQIIAYFKKNYPYTGIPHFDLVLLGMGADGHTASLFPPASAISTRNNLVAYIKTPGLAPFVSRISMTLLLLNNAHTVIFLIYGRDKLPIIEEIRQQPEEASKKYPAALIKPQHELLWYIVDLAYNPNKKNNLVNS
jgi:6-phosphogluconolactonase